METQTKAIIIEQEDKSLVISYPAHDDYIDLIIERNSPRTCKVVNREELDFNTLNFLPALYFNSEKEIFPNIDKAKDIWLSHYRRARSPLLASLDIDFMRAVESGNTELQQEIAAKKQALRDVTKTELPDTLEGIKNTWPEILGENPF